MLYVLTPDGWLSTLNKDTGSITRVAQMPFNELYHYQDMEFDRTTGRLYWVMCSVDYDEAENSWLVEVDFTDPNDLKIDLVGRIGLSADLFGMYIPYASSLQAPGTPTDMAYSYKESDPYEITINWKNPTTTFEGGKLDQINGVVVFRDGKQIKTFTGVTPGQEMSYVDHPEETPGMHRYEILAFNMQGDGQKYIARIYAGYDIPAQVGNLTAVPADDISSITVSWDAPEAGDNNGMIRKEDLRYRVKRLPDNLTLFEDLDKTSFKDENFRRALNYSYEVTAYNKEGETTAVTAGNVAGPGKELPFEENFYDIYDFNNLWTSVDANGDLHKWVFFSGMGNTVFGDYESAVEYMLSVYDASPDLDKSDDWLISPPLSFEAGKKYEMLVKARSLNVENLEFCFGPGTSHKLMKPFAQAELMTYAYDPEADGQGFHTYLFDLPVDGLEKGCVGVHIVTDIDAMYPSCFIQVHQVSVGEKGTLDSVADIEGDGISVAGHDGKVTVSGSYDSALVYGIDGKYLGGVDNEYASGLYIVTVKSGKTTRNFRVML